MHEELIKRLRYMHSRFGDGIYKESADALESCAKDAEIGHAIELAAEKLPDGYQIEVSIERGARSVYLVDPDGGSMPMDIDADNRLVAEIKGAIDAAIAREAK